MNTYTNIPPISYIFVGVTAAVLSYATWSELKQEDIPQDELVDQIEEQDEPISIEESEMIEQQEEVKEEPPKEEDTEVNNEILPEEPPKEEDAEVNNEILPEEPPKEKVVGGKKRRNMTKKNKRRKNRKQTKQTKLKSR